MATWSICESPVGRLTLIGGPDGLRALHFPGECGDLDDAARDDEGLADAIDQLQEYFAGERRSFDLNLDLRGTPFQREVWTQLSAIPYGATRSYGALSAAIGRADRSRAVGAAVGRTPIPIIVPCHRAVGADGSLTGYRGGLRRKRALLDLEAGVRRLERQPSAEYVRSVDWDECAAEGAWGGVKSGLRAGRHLGGTRG
ncbi:MAG TPA: methylated-DNA--[protein]-cysteine S-methyltransferase [Solirubrobacteraceae bacterium]